MNKKLHSRAQHLSVHCILVILGLLFATPAYSDESDHRLSMTMKNADLADVMDMISREQRINVFVSTDSVETVSFSIYDMRLPDAIRAIANAAGLAVEYYQGSYFVVDRDEAGKYAPDAITEVQAFELQYVSVEEIQALLKPFLSDYGEITTFEDRNLFLVEDTPAFLRRVASLVDRIDESPTQILIEARILEITLTDNDAFGLDWERAFNANGGSGNYGVQGLSTPTANGFLFEYTNPNFTATLNALTSQGRVRTLSSPTLLGIENQESSVIVGDRRGYSVTTTINQITTESVEFLESGVILNVIPHVDDENRVMLEIHPEVSTGVIDPLTGIPSQATTEVSTSMIVPDGQTIFVGGLIKHRVDESRSGIPVISRIPGIGRLFSNRNSNITNTETIVLITPTVLKPDSLGADQDAAEKINDFDSDQGRKTRKLEQEMDRTFGSVTPGT